jgi:pimeloyl-ACP methyl ester carboxylesterase
MEQFTSFDGTRIAFHQAGPTGDGAPPVVLHHGFVVDAKLNWVSPGIVDALVQSGRRVVTIDARGHGRSEKPHDASRYGEATMARDLSALFDRIGAPEVDLAGYSMGAIVSLIAATQDRRIRRLVVGGVGEAVIDLGGVDTRVIPNDLLVAGLLADDPASVHPAAAGFRMLADAIGSDRLALAAQARSVHRAPIPLERIAAPTLVLVGDTDLLAAEPQRLADAIPEASLEIVPGDHQLAVLAPRFTEALVDFLGR